MEPDANRDARFMARALQLAARGLETTDPNPRVGCVLVQGDSIVGEGWHRRAGSAHAEVEALAVAGAAAQGSTAYVTLEPCCHFGRTPPCTDALIAAGVRRVVAAMVDPNPLVAGKGLERLQSAGIETVAGILEADAERLNRGFCKRMRTGRPFVFSKIAMSLDGRTALANGESRWITGAAARQDVHRLRARSSAIVTGIGTVLADDPMLTVRLEDTDGERRQPLRVVLDTGMRLPVGANLLKGGGRVLVIGSDRAVCGDRSDVDQRQVPVGADGRLELSAVLDVLGQLQCNEVMIEAGPTLNGAFLVAGLVDEWIIYQAPCVLGDRGRGMFGWQGPDSMAGRIGLERTDVRPIGADLKLTFRPRPTT